MSHKPGQDLEKSRYLGETNDDVSCQVDFSEVKLTSESWPSVYNASVFPSSAECCSKSITLIAFPCISSSFFLAPLAPSLPVRFGQAFCCNFTMMRAALAIGPCPWRFRMEDNVELKLAPDELEYRSGPFEDGFETMPERVDNACLYARVAWT